MSKQSSTKPIPSSGEAEFVRLVAKREDTIGKRLRKVTVKTLVFLFIFCLGFILSELRYTDQANQMDDSRLFLPVHVFDTEQKVDDYHKMIRRLYSEETGLSFESHEVDEFMAKWQREQGQPLVEVGPFAVFVDNDGGRFSVREKQSLKQMKGLLLPLVELESQEHSKQLHFYSSQEKNLHLPRFNATICYSEDGIYDNKKSIFHVYGEDEKFHRFYLDTKGTGIFDAMYVYENKVLTRYKLNGLSWERTDEQPFTETLETDLDMEKVIE